MNIDGAEKTKLPHCVMMRFRFGAYFESYKHPSADILSFEMISISTRKQWLHSKAMHKHRYA